MGRGQGNGTVAPSFPAGVRTVLLTVEGRSGRSLTLRLSRPSGDAPVEVVFDGAGGSLLVPPQWRPAFAELSVRHRGEWTLRLRESTDGPPRDAVPGAPADERLDAFRAPDGAYAGRGEDSAVFARPERGRAAVLEFGFDELVERRPVGVLIDGPRGDRRADFRLITAVSPQRMLLWHTDDTANLPTLRVRAGAEGPWWARLLDLDHLRRLVDRTEGEGHDVLRYDGRPALLSFTVPRDNDHLLVGSWGGAHGVRLYHSPYAERTGSDLIGAGEGTELIDIRSSGRWEARVDPIAGAREFGDTVTGRGPEILRWTGRSRRGGRAGRLALVNLASNDDPGSVTADSLGEDLRRLGSASAFPQDGGRPAVLHTPLSPGCLIRVTDSSFSGWRLQVG
ncbi:hypothetical protein [Kitasatospora sp. NPDC091207]|uniref:hypothetical protein n=1 Tax=Kitasatospora sp. NPDC091207 TaxID=3364083 RepID=UPI0038013408